MSQNVVVPMILLAICAAGIATVEIAAAQPPVRPPAAEVGAAWVTAEIPGPRVTYQTFESALVKTKVSYHIYKPVEYDRDTERRFPVVYWLHGSGGGLPGIPRVATLFDAAIQAGKTPPCLVVFVNGLAEGMYVDWKDGAAPIETMIIKELVPHIDTTHRTIATRDGRLLDGYSMGGYGSARLGFKYNDLFKGISIMGGGPLQPELVQAPRAGRQRAAEVLQKVYGGDQEYFRSVSPRRLSEENAEAMRGNSIIRMVCAVARAERLAAIAPVVASMFTFEKMPSVPLPILIINGVKDDEVPLEGGMSRNPLVRAAQDAPYKPLKDVVRFWVDANKSQNEPKVANVGTVTTTVYAATSEGAATEFVVDSVGAHGWPGTRSRRDGNAPISFPGANRVWEFFVDKHR